MGDKYKPNYKEIVSGSSKIIGKAIKDFSKDFSFGAIEASSFLLALSTTYRRKICEGKGFRLEKIFEEQYSQSAMPLFGYITGITSIIGVLASIPKEPKYGLMLIATNVLSGAYELQRTVRKNLENKVDDGEE